MKLVVFLSLLFGFWHPGDPVEPPSPRSGFCMAYDKHAQSVVLFGGQDSTGQKLGDTWLWSPDSGWSLISHSGPSPRINGAMTYIDHLQSVLLFGGLTDQGCTDELWFFRNGEWTNSETMDLPPARQLGTIAYNPSEKKAILFGGKDNANNRLGDTWSFHDDHWTQLSEGPSARSSHAMEYLPTSKSVVLYGGYDGQSLGDFWEIRKDAWQKIERWSGPPRLHATLGYNLKEERLLLFGGFGPGGRSNELYTLIEGQWSILTAAKSPSPRAEHECVSIPSLGLFIFGGVLGEDPKTRVRGNDTWLFTSGEWESIK